MEFHLRRKKSFQSSLFSAGTSHPFYMFLKSQVVLALFKHPQKKGSKAYEIYVFFTSSASKQQHIHTGMGILTTLSRF